MKFCLILIKYHRRYKKIKKNGVIIIVVVIRGMYSYRECNTRNNFI